MTIDRGSVQVAHLGMPLKNTTTVAISAPRAPSMLHRYERS